jgi:ketosteroid isomerase-like protein
MTENADLIRKMNHAFNQGDIVEVMRFYAPDAEVRDLANAPDQPAVITGIDAIRDTWSLWAGAFDELQVDIDELSEDEDAVIVKAHWHGIGKTSGMSIDVRQFDLYELEGGRVIRMTLGLKTLGDAQAATLGNRPDT